MNDGNPYEMIDRRFSLMDTSVYEAVSDKYKDKQPSIAIRHLRKYFESLWGGDAGTVKAVDGVSLDMYEGQVFCLLGHNGAGKTTTIGCLSGLLDITSGDAWILGKNVNESMDEARKYMGVCPQHDVLFQYLTVREHLQLYAKLKGVKKEYIESEVEATIDVVGLRERATFFPTQLSGGQKRKLSLGIAFIGQSKIVFLDEPTSGMDVQARRVAWDIIEKEKKHRTIILTTHYMDEADILGDRIAIMASGKVRCCGSPLFLKQCYGVGYSFTISLKIGVKPMSVKPKIDNIVLKHINNAAALSVAGGELNYRLPFGDSDKFSYMFEELDELQANENVGISSYGISVTTLEEVFIKIGNNEENEIEGAETADLNENSAFDLPQSNELETKMNGYQPVAENGLESSQQTQNGASAPLSSDSNGYDSMNNFDDEKNERTKKNKNNTSNVNTEPMVLTGNAYENPFEQPTFKLGLGNDATTYDKFEQEFRIFFIHTWAIMYRRFWWSLRDFRAILCQVLIPAVLAAIGLGVTKLVFDTTYPKLDMTVTQWYSDPSKYSVPISNITDSTAINNPILSDLNEWNNVYSNYMVDDFGELSYYSVNSTQAADGTYYTDLLLDEASSDGKYIHYNSYYLPNASTSIVDGSKIVMMLGMNLSAYHSYPIAYNAYYNWLLKTQINTSASINLASYPFPTTETESVLDEFVLGLMAAFYLLIAFAFVPVGAIFQIIQDRVSLTKHQQFVSGLSLLSYWVGNYIADFINAIPACILVVIMIFIFDTSSFQGNAFLPFVMSILLFIFSILPFTYLLSFLFNDPSAGQRWVALLYIILGLVLLLVSYLLDYIGSKATANTNDDLKPYYRIFPTYLVSESIYHISLKQYVYPDDTYWDWAVCGKDLVYMVYEGLGYFALLLVIEWASHKPKILRLLGFVANIPKENDPPFQLDEDVEAEQTRIQSAVTYNNDNELVLDSDQCDDSVILAGLRKVYKRKLCSPITAVDNSNTAVKDLWFGVPQGQVFGFLGVNGAGKTTSLAMLTGERFASDGTAFIHGYPVDQQNMIRRFIGYCPQFDALFELLTAEEHLKFYGTLKGLKGKELQTQIDMLLNVLSLNKYRHRRAGTYSGGNKRKLSVAMSMIGNPPIVFLDEPSCGMDPVSRRHMWEFISKTMEGRAVVLTTHSMEECEALCHRLAIMVGGTLMCIGTPQHLKTTFGDGYQLDLTLKDSKSATRISVEEGLMTVFDVKTLEINRHKVRYQLTGKADINGQVVEMSLAQLFKELEIIKSQKPIVSYAVSQTSLEQIFLKMAREDIERNRKAEEDNNPSFNANVEGMEGVADSGANSNGNGIETANADSAQAPPVYQ